MEQTDKITKIVMGMNGVHSALTAHLIVNEANELFNVLFPGHKPIGEFDQQEILAFLLVCVHIANVMNQGREEMR